MLIIKHKKGHPVFELRVPFLFHDSTLKDNYLESNPRGK